MSKPAIKQTAYGNWYGYKGRRRVIAFADMPTHTAEQAAVEWLAKWKVTPDRRTA
jgi:hypothetical protein